MAELLTAALLVVAGVLALARRASPMGAPLSALALGALLYTVINSPATTPTSASGRW